LWPSRSSGFRSRIHFLVQHRFGQAEFGDLGAHHAAGIGIAVIQHDFIAQRQQVARHGQRSWPGANQRHALAVLLRRGRGHARLHIILVVGSDPLEAADGNRLGLLGDFFDAATAAGRFARTVAGAAQHAGKHVGMPVDHIGVGITPRRYHADIFGNRGVGGAGPLAVHDFVEVVGIGDVRGLHPHGWLAIHRARRLPGRFTHRCTTHAADCFPNDTPQKDQRLTDIQLCVRMVLGVLRSLFFQHVRGLAGCFS
jgi:hypothetical protein